MQTKWENQTWKERFDMKKIFIWSKTSKLFFYSIFWLTSNLATIFLLFNKTNYCAARKFTIWKRDQKNICQKRNRTPKFVSLLLHPSSTISKLHVPCADFKSAHSSSRCAIYEIYFMFWQWHSRNIVIFKVSHAIIDVVKCFMIELRSEEWIEPRWLCKSLSTTVLTSNLLNFEWLHSILTYCWRLRWLFALSRLLN